MHSDRLHPSPRRICTHLGTTTNRIEFFFDIFIFLFVNSGFQTNRKSLFFLQTFQLELLRKMAKIMFGENPRETKSMARIINKQHFLRLKNILDDPSVQSCIVHGGGVDEDNL